LGQEEPFPARRLSGREAPIAAVAVTANHRHGSTGHAEVTEGSASPV
jgi:hypothetical protein